MYLPLMGLLKLPLSLFPGVKPLGYRKVSNLGTSKILAYAQASDTPCPSKFTLEIGL